MSTFDPAPLVDSLRSFPEALRAYLANTTDEAARWQPDVTSNADDSTPERPWSILQVACHLVDEERDDFSMRVRMTLEDPTQDWPPIDPERTARERSYDLSLADAIEQFADARATSIDWLDSLDAPDWSRAYNHPRFREVPAGELLAGWAAHDHFHMRQIIKRWIQWLAEQATPYPIDYAGGIL